jgi:protocatechuate 3,4-dioxygenase beta subunit
LSVHRHLCVLLLSFLCCASLAHAQTPDEKNTGTVSGRVIWQGIGAGIHKVVVTINAQDVESQMLTEFTTSTDSEGRFRIEAIPPGTYTVILRRPGFVSAEKKPGQLQVTVTAGQETSGLFYKMEATGVIAGKITEADGDPLPGVSVWVNPAAGEKSAEFALNQDANGGQETTNDLGEFRIANLRTGQYIVQAQAHGMNPVPDPADKGRQKDLPTYALTYFPGTPDSRTATPLQVTPGGTAVANFSIITSRSYHVSGTVTVAGNPHNIQMYLVSTTGQTEAQPLGDGGKFDFGGILPGTYVAQFVDMSSGLAEGPPQSRTQMIGSPIVVSNADVASLVLQPEANGSVTGKVHTEDGSSLDWKQLNVSLIRIPQDEELPQLSNIGALGGSVQLKEDGTFEMKDVAGATYWVFMGGPASQYGDYYLKSVSVDGREVSDTGLAVTGPTTVDVLLSAKGASVDGTVVDSHGQPVAGITVVSLPTSGKAGRLDLYVVVETDSTGHFSMHALDPGTYVLVAVENVPDNPRTPDFAKKYADKGETVDLGESDKKTVVLKMPEEP